MTNEDVTPLKPFKADGCTLSPDFNFRHCYEEHDRHSWRGGTREQRIEVDIAFRNCIRDAGHPFLAEIYFRRSGLPRPRYRQSLGGGGLVGRGPKDTNPDTMPHC